ncbi:hypothetical protein [Clostridium tagluense]|nr:hypothetical protein [Clostridium tagluense]
MNTARYILFNLIEDVPENEVLEVIDFIGCLKINSEKSTNLHV